MTHTPSLLIRKPKPETEKTLFAIFYFYLHQTLNGHLGPSETPENHCRPFTGQISSWPSNQMHFKLSKQREIGSNRVFLSGPCGWTNLLLQLTLHMVFKSSYMFIPWLGTCGTLCDIITLWNLNLIRYLVKFSALPNQKVWNSNAKHCLAVPVIVENRVWRFRLVQEP